MRRRSGFAASATYNYAKALDNASLGGRGQSAGVIAQNWLDLRGERHLLNTMVSYTSGMGVRGGSLGNGKLAGLLKEWTLSTQTNVGSRLPLNPVYLFAPCLAPE